MSEKIIWSSVDTQRASLTDFLKTLNEDEWEAPSLCKGWTVREVVAHVVLTNRYGDYGSLKAIVKHGFNLNSFMFNLAKGVGKKSTNELIAMLRADIGVHKSPLMVKPIGVLTDLVVHEMDIRIPLMKERPVDSAALKLILDAFNDKGYGIGDYLVGIKRIAKGIRFEATDIDWSTNAPKLVIQGKAQDVLMVIAGRTAVLPRLSGNGLKVLSKRLN